MKHRSLAIASLALLSVLVNGCGKEVLPPPTPDAGPEDCAPACTEVQTCNKSESPPFCEEICNAPSGCRVGDPWYEENIMPWEVCNTQTTECEPVSCDEGVCTLGQSCISFASYTFDPPSACTCLPQLTLRLPSGSTYKIRDTCAPYGKICAFDVAAAVAGKAKPASCRLPTEWENCSTRVGCEKGFVCNPEYGVCMRTCTQTEDCPSRATYCSEDHYCENNICANPAENGDSDRAKFFASCDALGSGDGICAPVYNDAGDAYGLCLQTGCVGATCSGGGSGRLYCDPAAERPVLEAMCPGAEMCVGIEPDSEHPGALRGVCQPMCNAGTADSIDPAVGCEGEGKICYDLSGILDLYREKSISAKTRLGVCLPGCDLFGNDTCPLEDALGNPMGCMPAGNGTIGYCGSISPEPSGFDESCAQAAGDPRNSCGDRLACVYLSGESWGTCLPYCDTLICKNETEECRTCSQTRCVAGSCTPDCDGRQCGWNGCNGVCGTCAEGQECDASGQCVDIAACVNPDCLNHRDGMVCYLGKCTIPDCSGKMCGPDGAGGFCGTCGGAEFCEAIVADQPLTCTELNSGTRKGLCVPMEVN